MPSGSVHDLFCGLPEAVNETTLGRSPMYKADLVDPLNARGVELADARNLTKRAFVQMSGAANQLAADILMPWQKLQSLIETRTPERLAEIFTI